MLSTRLLRQDRASVFLEYVMISLAFFGVVFAFTELSRFLHRQGVAIRLASEMARFISVHADQHYPAACTCAAGNCDKVGTQSSADSEARDQPWYAGLRNAASITNEATDIRVTLFWTGDIVASAGGIPAPRPMVQVQVDVTHLCVTGFYCPAGVWTASILLPVESSKC